MFLVKQTRDDGGSSVALYTGDFRVCEGETCEHIPAILKKGRTLLNEVVYDATFENAPIDSFCTREAAKLLVVQKCRQHLMSSPNSIVHLNCTMYGYEHILLAVGQELEQLDLQTSTGKKATRLQQLKIHVSGRDYEKFVAACPQLDKYLIAQSGQNQRVHCCHSEIVGKTVGMVGKERKRLPCCDSATRETLLSINPSMLWFMQEAKHLRRHCGGRAKSSEGVVDQHRQHHIQHSMHSSQNEIQMFLKNVTASNPSCKLRPFAQAQTESSGRRSSSARKNSASAEGDCKRAKLDAGKGKEVVDFDTVGSLCADEAGGPAHKESNGDNSDCESLELD